MLCFKSQTALFRLFELALTIGKLVIEELNGLPHLTSGAPEILLAEYVDHPLDDVLRELGIGGVGQIASAACCGDFEKVVGFALDLDVFRQVSNRLFHLALGSDARSDCGRTDHLLQVHRAGQRLSDSLDVLFASGGADSDLLGKRVVQLDEDAGLCLVAIREQRHRKPAQQADAPGYAQREPAAIPYRPKRCLRFFDQRIHAIAPALVTIRTCFRE